jgi:hypothetical protein
MASQRLNIIGDPYFVDPSFSEGQPTMRSPETTQTQNAP